MLQIIRNYAGSFVVKILFAVLILSFFIWGIADVFRPHAGAEWAAKVGDREISRAAFDHEYQATARRVQQQLGGRFDAEAMRSLGLGRNVANQMINRTLIQEEAAALGIASSDDAVRKLVSEDRRFRNAEGQFDPRVLQAFIRQTGMSEKDFFAELRSELDISAILESVQGGAVLPVAMADSIRAYATEKRTIDYVRIVFDQQRLAAEPDEATLRAYYAKHIQDYMTPEVRAVSLLVVDRAAVASQVTIEDADLKALYEERVDEFSVPERRRFAQILVSDEAAARQVANRLREGASLEDAGRAVGLGASAVTRIGPVAETQLPAELRTPVFAGKQAGPLTDPVHSSLGWHVIDVIDIEAGSVRPFAEVASQLREEAIREKAEERVIDLGNKIEDGLGRGQPLDEIAGAIGLSVRSIPAITAAGTDAAGNPVAGLPEKLAATAFAVAKGATSDLVESEGGEYFLVRVDEVTPAVERDFSTVEKAVRDAWRAEAQRQQADEVAAKVAERAGSGSLADAARDFGLTVATTGLVDRGGGSDSAVPPEVVRRALEGAAGQVATVPTADAVFVLKTTAVAAAATAETTPAVRRELDQATSGLREDLLSQYLAALKTRYPVAINEAVVMQSPRTN
ncbi:MAG: SurA N-terminal domain-containing protein [Rhodospirillales bacterium]